MVNVLKSLSSHYDLVFPSPLKLGAGCKLDDIGYNKVHLTMTSLKYSRTDPFLEDLTD